MNDIMLGSQRMDDVTRNSRITAEYLVVAGGAAGADSGGNGAGGLLSGSLTLLGGIVYQVYVAPKVGGTSDGTQGNNSYFTGSNAYLYAFGGGYGANFNSARGTTGGSGGGGANNDGGDYGGKVGIAGQGTTGGDGSITTRHGGGGGGAGSAGGNGSTTIGGKGGNGKQSAIDGTLQYYAGGGAGCQNIGAPQYGTPGLGAPAVGSSARDNSGSGNNAKDPTTFAGSGYVVIRYLGNQIATGGIVVKDGDYTVHKFSDTGSAIFYLN